MKLKTLTIFIVAILSGGLLLYTSQAVQNTQRDLRAAKAQLKNEQDATHVLNAEWSFLSSPERLEAIATEHLDLSQDAPAPEQSLETMRDNNDASDVKGAQ